MLDISNYYEQLVIDHLWKINGKDGSEPMTQAFLEDVACLALNMLPVCYVRNAVDKSAHITESNFLEMSEAVEKAIAQAIAQVHHRPHDIRDV